MSWQMVELALKGASAKGASWQVLVVLAAYANADGSRAWVAAQTIVDESNLSHRAVRNALKELRAAGYFAEDGVSPYGTPDRRLTPDTWPPKCPSVSERGAASRNNMPTGRRGIPTGRHPVPLMSEPGAPDPPEDPPDDPTPQPPAAAGGDIPRRPSSKRRRDADNFDAQVRQYATERFPDIEEAQAVQAVHWAIGRPGADGGEPTHDDIKAWVNELTNASDLPAGVAIPRGSARGQARPPLLQPADALRAHVPTQQGDSR